MDQASATLLQGLCAGSRKNVVNKEGGSAILHPGPGGHADSSRARDTFRYGRYLMPSLHAQLLLDVTELDYHAISITIPDGHTQSAETRDGALLSVDVKNALPCVGAMTTIMMPYAESIAGLLFRRNHIMRCWTRFKLVMFHQWCIYAYTGLEHGHAVLSCEYSQIFEVFLAQSHRSPLPPVFIHLRRHPSG